MEEFNLYLKNIDRDSLKDLCISKGKLIKYGKNEYFSTIEQPSSYIGFVQKGAFKYVCFNSSEGKEYNSGFSFANEFIGDYPSCLYQIPLEVSIQAITHGEVYVYESEKLEQYFNQDMTTQRKARTIAEQLFLQTYSRFLDTYRKTPEERYKELLQRCPEILQMISLKDLSSYLKITPIHMSRIRHKITFIE